MSPLHLANATPRCVTAGMVSLSLLTTGAHAEPNLKVEVPTVVMAVPNLPMFLDRLMRAESGGRNDAANPRSSALGPFQFIKSTFIDIARRYFPAKVAELTDEQVLELRTQRAFARAAAAAFTMENAAHLHGQGLEPTPAHLRLAFLLGPSGASRVLQAEPAEALAKILEPSVLRANPFMAGMSASDLVAKATRDVRGASRMVVARPGARVRPVARARPGGKARAVAIDAKCNRKLVSCKRWIALQKAKKLRKIRSVQGSAGKRSKI